jgi:hypothetical protein
MAVRAGQIWSFHAQPADTAVECAEVRPTQARISAEIRIPLLWGNLTGVVQFAL